MQDPTRYLDSLHRPPHMQPPICLQYAILAMAATVSPAHKELALPFYYRARNYIERDEMKGGRRVLAENLVQLRQLIGLYVLGRWSPHHYDRSCPVLASAVAF